MKRFVCLLFLLLLAPVFAQETASLLLFVRGDLDSTIGIYVLNADTGEERLLRELAPNENAPNGHDFGWSPDGRVWLVDSNTNGKPQLSFINAESGEESLFGESMGWRTCASAVEWSPDGRYMSYSTDSNEQEEGLTIYNMESESSYRLPWIGQHFPYWSPTGNAMLIYDNYFMEYDDENPAATLLLLSEDGSEVLRRGPEDNSFGFAFSPDGRFFAYDDDGSIWLYEIETGATTNLEVSASYFHWSPEGRYLLMENSENEPVFNVSQSYYDSQTGQISPINLPDSSTFAAWGSEEGQLLLSTNFGTIAGYLYPQSLLAYDMETGSSETLMEAEDESWIGDVYQVGNWFAAMYYTLEDASNMDWIASARLSNGETTLDLALSVDASSTLSLNASPDARWLSIKDQHNLYLLDASTGGLERLPIAETTVDSPFWSPNSRYLAFQSGEQLAIWNSESQSLELLPEGISAIVGWQHGDWQMSLVCRHGYGDGNP